MPARGSLWLIYALGGGWGHLTRAVALARAASGQRVRILTNSPYAAQVHSVMPELDLVAVNPELPVAEARERALHYIRTASPGCLIVDTFPRGLGGELAGCLDSLAPVRVLVHRDLNPRYVEEAGLREFVESKYDLVLIAGEGEGRAFGHLATARVTAPWLIRPPSNSGYASLRSRLGQWSRNVGAFESVLVCAGGTEEELAWYGAVVTRLDRKATVRCVAPVCPPGCSRELWIEHWPAIDLYATAGVVVGGAGYNTIHECLAYGIPLIARPWPRKYDRQWLRARRAARLGSVTIVKHPEEAAAEAIRQLRARPAKPLLGIRNGTLDAVELILDAIAKATLL